MASLKDYKPYDWHLKHVDLDFTFDYKLPDQSSPYPATLVTGTLRLEKKNKSEFIFLDGESLALVSLLINGQSYMQQEILFLEESEVTQIKIKEQGVIVTPKGMHIYCNSERCTITSKVLIYPDANVALMGLYRSGAFLVTQCEAEGLRNITYCLDRPDVLATYATTLRGLVENYRWMVANGNKKYDSVVELNNQNYREVTYFDPHPKPSYLFALIAGNVERVTTTYTSCEETDTPVHFYCEPHLVAQTSIALQVLQDAMRWDELRYKRFYDLKEFHVAAVEHFYIKAMENKGLNIFSVDTALADARLTSDEEYQFLKAMIGHEYFHNWTGNRITCRDWFQLTVKEGLTTFRENQCVEEINPIGIERISMVEFIKHEQFLEDATGLAHPPRPHQYDTIDNYYTATIYDKGSEIIRMIYQYLGDELFVKGMQRYFQSCDGKAVTVEDYLLAMTHGANKSVKNFIRWYTQAGTPELTFSTSYDKKSSEYRISITQNHPAIFKHPLASYGKAKLLPIPIQISLYLENDLSKPIGEKKLLLTTKSKTVALPSMPESGVIPTFQNGLYAPVLVKYEYSLNQLKTLTDHQDLVVSRDAMERIFTLACTPDPLERPPAPALVTCLSDAIHRSIERASHEVTLWGHCGFLIAPMHESALIFSAQQLCDPCTILEQRKKVLQFVAAEIFDSALKLYSAVNIPIPVSEQFTMRAIQSRVLKSVVLQYIAIHDPSMAESLVRQLYQNSESMTDKVTALSVCTMDGVSESTREELFSLFINQYSHHAPARYRLMHVQTQRHEFNPSTDFKIITANPQLHWDEKNPSCLEAVYVNFHNANFSAFHSLDSSGYQAIFSFAAYLDEKNPQMAALLFRQCLIYPKLTDQCKSKIASALTAACSGKKLSVNAKEIIRLLYDLQV
ncbi:MAG: DUF3458 domain-containing protein [Methylacidiphilales bacterium]|nr:DUF3458 domain-containing protein [Candidatus Methylacidiphilales bacterium]